MRSEHWRRGDLLLAGAAIIVLACLRLALATLPFPVVRRGVGAVCRALCGRRMVEAASRREAVRRAVLRAGRVHRSAFCLPRALLALVMGALVGMRLVVHVGVHLDRDEPFGAHAWTTAPPDDAMVVGGREAGRNQPLLTIDPFHYN